MPSGPKKRRAAAKKKQELILEETRKIEDDQPTTELAQEEEVKPAESLINNKSVDGNLKVQDQDAVICPKFSEISPEIADGTGLTLLTAAMKNYNIDEHDDQEEEVVAMTDVLSEKTDDEEGKKDDDEKRIEIKQVIVMNKLVVEEQLKAVRKYEEELLEFLDKLKAIDP